MPPRALRDLAAHGFKFYEAFRPEVPAGAYGWSTAGALDRARPIALAETT